MKRIALLSLFLLFSGVFAEAGTLTQVSVIDALLAGAYEGETTLADLGAKGDLGIGTFDRLNGEMILVNGQFYRATSSGTIETPALTEKTPFASVAKLSAWVMAPLSAGLDLKGLEAFLKERFPSPNLYYALRADGKFRRMKVRSVPAQTPPYAPLLEVTARQPVFESENVEGTLVGFYSPPYAKGMNVPGVHLHFISVDRQKGGHVLGFELERGTIRWESLEKLEVLIPKTAGFLGANLTPDRANELKKIEQ